MSFLYVKLDASYDYDPKILEAGEQAEVLYLRSLCLVKRILSDGVVSDHHLPRFGLSDVDERAAKLVEVGLWEKVEGGFRIVSWFRHNSSKDEVEAVREGGERGNHVRWHVRKGRPKRGCQFCLDEGIAPVSGGESGGRVALESGGRIPETEAEAEAETEAETEAVKTSMSAVADPEVSQDARDLTRELAIAVKANGHKVPGPGQKAHGDWLRQMDLLLRKGAPGGDPDPQGVDEVRRVIEFATTDDFWRANIASPSKFRKQYPQLKIKAQGSRDVPKRRADGRILGMGGGVA